MTSNAEGAPVWVTTAGIPSAVFLSMSCSSSCFKLHETDRMPGRSQHFRMGGSFQAANEWQCCSREYRPSLSRASYRACCKMLSTMALPASRSQGWLGNLLGKRWTIFMRTKSPFASNWQPGNSRPTGSVGFCTIHWKTPARRLRW